MFRKMYFLTGCCLTAVLNVQSVRAAIDSAAATSYQLAYVQFLPDYQDSSWGDKRSMVIPGGGGFIPNVVNQCKEHGYEITSCPAGTVPSGRCPYSSKSYYKECISNNDACVSKGYFKTCSDGKVPDASEYCEYDHSYVKCECDDCSGYDFTYEQAMAAGYVVDGGGCQSCDEIRYKRKANPCEGYGYDSSNCGNVSCGTLSGATCQSGNTVKYAECKACGCSQTTCLDYPDTEISCTPGYVKVSCTDSCVGTRYKCEKASGCEGYDKTSKTGCTYGYLDCVDTSGQTLYKCKDCSPSNDCSAYTLTAQSGCTNGYLSCENGCGTTTYKCKKCPDYSVGDAYYSNGLLLGVIIDIKDSNMVIATVPNGSSDEVDSFCSYKSPGNWVAPSKTYGKKIFKVYDANGVINGNWSYFRIAGAADNEYCVNGSSYWSKSMCSSSLYTLYNSCVASVLKCEEDDEPEPYSVGDAYYVDSILWGVVIDINGSNVIVASPPNGSSDEVDSFCGRMSPGSWVAPSKTYGKKIFKVYDANGVINGNWSYFRIAGAADDEYCVNGSSYWSKSMCSSSLYTLYNSCVISVPQIQ